MILKNCFEYTSKVYRAAAMESVSVPDVHKQVAAEGVLTAVSFLKLQEDAKKLHQAGSDASTLDSALVKVFVDSGLSSEEVRRTPSV